MNTDLTLKERRDKILEILHTEGKVKVAELSALFNVSEVSIRNDLAELESEGVLSRVHGGAVGSYASYYHMSLAQRSGTNKASKDAIAAKIADMIGDQQTVLMNAGTTTLAVMHMLANKRDVTIVTNSVVLALEGAKYPNLHVLLLGGNVDYEYQYVHGTMTLKQLKEFYVDLLILSADGIDAEHGISTYYDAEADICRQMIKQSKRVIAALDHTKIGRVTFRNIADAEKVDCVVTTPIADPDALEALREKGIQIVFSEPINERG